MPKFDDVGVYSIYVYGAPREHNPPHFHVKLGNDSICRFEIKDFNQMDNYDFKSKDLKMLEEFWTENQTDLLDYFCYLNPSLCASR